MNITYLRIENGFDISKITGAIPQNIGEDISLISQVNNTQLLVAILKTKRDY